MSDSETRSYTEVRWGVLYLEDEGFRKAGQIEAFGTRPGGDIGAFTEDDCRYIAGGNANRRVVSQTIVHSSKYSEWEKA